MKRRAVSNNNRGFERIILCSSSLVIVLSFIISNSFRSLSFYIYLLLPGCNAPSRHHPAMLLFPPTTRLKADKAAASSPLICASLSATCRRQTRHSSASLASLTLRQSPSTTDILHLRFAVFTSPSFIMQTISAESSLGKAPKACKFCRSRKKKCDKALPRCGFCAR